MAEMGNSVCFTCGLNHDGDHELLEDCIYALREAMLKQRQAAERLGHDITMRVLGVLEELALRPECRCSNFTVLHPQTQKPLLVAPEQVAGVFAAILDRYKQMGDWSPLEEARGEAIFYRKRCGEMDALLEKIEDELPEEAVAECRRVRSLYREGLKSPRA